MIKYSDASNVEKVAAKDCSSAQPMKDCCYELAMRKDAGSYTCECGNSVCVTKDKQ
jgi:hypothetical protein